MSEYIRDLVYADIEDRQKADHILALEQRLVATEADRLATLQDHLTSRIAHTDQLIRQLAKLVKHNRATPVPR